MRSNHQYFIFKKPLVTIVTVIASLTSSSLAYAQENTEAIIFPPVPQLEQDKDKKTSNDEGVAVATAASPPSALNIRQASYGTWSKSLMFPEKEIQYMKTILDEYEATGEVPLSLQDLPDVIDVIGEPIVEINEYPSFHLKTILYHSPSHWSVWINDIKITSRDNNLGESELKVVNVSEDIVRFKWSPADTTFMNELVRQLPQLKKVADDTVLPIINRASRSARAATISDDNTALYFTLRLNESFSTETFYTFDGKPPTLSYPSLAVPYSLTSNSVTASKKQGAPEAVMDDGEESALEKIENLEKDNPALDRQSPKDIIDAISSPEIVKDAIKSLTPEQAAKAIEAITK